MRFTSVAIWRRLTRGLRVLGNQRTADRDLHDELSHYVEQLVATRIREGLTPEEARRSAQLEVGNTTNIREHVRASLWETAVSSAWADVRYALRTLRRNPVVTLVVCSVIAVGIGAVTTIFSGVNAYLFKPLPGAFNAVRLLQIDRTKPGTDESAQGSYPFYLHVRDATTRLSGVAAWSKVDLTISRGSAGVAAYGNIVSDNYFSVLGVQPALGRFFLPGEDRPGGAHAVVVVAHDFWRTHLNADSSVVGKTINVNGQAFTLIGVASPDFHGVFTPLRTAAWVTLSMQSTLKPQRSLESRDYWLWMFGRISETATVQQANSELSTLLQSYIQRGDEPAWARRYTGIRVFALTGLPDDARKTMAAFLSVLLAASLLVLVIAGVNVAAMLSARAIARRHEMALRAALGAQRGRLIRQLVTETLVLFLVGALGGIVLAFVATRGLEQMPLPTEQPLVITLPIDLRVLSFSVALSVACGIGFGLLPALRAARRDLQTQLRTGTSGSGRRRPIVSNILIVGQLSLSMTLLISGGLLVRALQRGQLTDPGFNPSGVSLAMLTSEAWGYNESKATQFFEQLRERAAQLPGVQSVSYTGIVPATMQGSRGEIEIAGQNSSNGNSGQALSIGISTIGPGYFDVLDIQLVEGRAFAATDGKSAENVAVINETLAKKLAPAGSAIGRTFKWDDKVIVVVGVARDAKYETLDESATPFVYLPIAQQWRSDQTVLVKSSTGEIAMARALADAIHEIDPGLPTPKVLTLRASMSFALIPQRVAALVAGALGLTGLLLATIGLYGIVTYSVGQRSREIGIRMTLGAQRREVERGVLREGMQLAALGVVLGLVVSAGASRLLTSYLYGVSPLDGRTYAFMTLLFVTVTFIANYLPARRASLADPMQVLRSE